MMYPQKGMISSSLSVFVDEEVQKRYLKLPTSYHRKTFILNELRDRNELMRYFNPMSHLTTLQRQQFMHVALLQIEHSEKYVTDEEIKQYFHLLHALHDINVSGRDNLMLKKMQNKMEVKIMESLQPVEANRVNIEHFLRVSMLLGDGTFIYEQSTKDALAKLCAFIAKKKK